MQLEYELIAAGACTITILLLAVYVFVLIRQKRRAESELDDSLQEINALNDARMNDKQAFGQLERERNELDKQLAVACEKADRIRVVEADNIEKRQKLETLQARIEQLSGSLAKETEKARQVQVLSDELAAKDGLIATYQKREAQHQAAIAELKTIIKKERIQSEEKLTLLNEAKTELSLQFKSLAQDIFDEKGKKFTEHNQSNMDALLTPFREQIADFKKKVEDVHVSDASDRARLKQELSSLRELNRQINQEAVNLTRALKGTKKVQGNWGEMILERVLEQSGLRKGEEYETQGGFRDSENRLLKPDVIIRLPLGKDIVVDSKVSLVDYERYCNTEDEAEQLDALKKHAGAVRTHIDTLSRKNYSDLTGLRSLDFVLMFVPIESAFLSAFQYDKKLFSDAFEKNIIVVTPTTLIATLRTIENIWRYERQNKNAQIIAGKAGAIYDKLRGFAEDMDKLGKQIGNVHASYEGAMTKLTVGRGNLISQATQFLNLGVKVKKEIPKSILERSEIETPGPAGIDLPEILN